MRSSGDLVFKPAWTEDELEQIRRLTYETFVEEIPQHASRSDRLLTDKFEEENTYFICLDQGRLVGMLALRARRPFSLDGKLAEVDSYLPPHTSPCEFRLLSVRPAYRKQRVAVGLMALAWKTCRNRGHDLALISGTTRQLKLYAHIGFQPFGPLVGTPGAEFQPMFLTLEQFRAGLERTLGAAFAPMYREPVNLLPGPVEIQPWVRDAFAAPAISHRSAEFKALLRATKGMLRSMTGAAAVEIATGCGTFANDMVAAHLAGLPGSGLVLSNGEFGNRLLDHAARAGLRHHALRFGWGEPFDYHCVETALDRAQDAAWLWCVHGETSTGVLNDLPRLNEICRVRDLALCLDGVSTIGAEPVDLQGVALASGCSGKALGAFTGLALLFRGDGGGGVVGAGGRARGVLGVGAGAVGEEEPASHRRGTPRALDLTLYRSRGGIPFTLSSNLVNALRASLERLDVPARAARIRVVSAWLRERLAEMGLPVLAPAAHAFPAVTTIPLPRAVPSLEVGRELVARGFLVSYESGYLVDRNWIQVCLMREASITLLEPFVEALRGALAAD